MDVTALMEKAIGQQAADLHLQTGRPPMLRLAQGLCSFPGPPLSEDDVRCLLHAVGWTRDEVGDGAFSWRRSLRCRLHVCREYAGLHATIRFLYPLASLPPFRWLPEGAGAEDWQPAGPSPAVRCLMEDFQLTQATAMLAFL